MNGKNVPQIVGPEYQNHWVQNQPQEIYHQDEGSISSTSLRYFLRSPQHFKAFHVERRQKEQTRAMEFGTMVHAMVLEPQEFLNRYTVRPSAPLNTKVGKALHEKWAHENQHKHLVSQDQMDRLVGIAEAITSHPYAARLLKGSDNEVSGYYRDPVTGLRCRIRPDALFKGGRGFIDIKKTVDADYEPFWNSIKKYRYDIQMAMYDEGIKEIQGQAPEVSIIIAIEEEYPHGIAVYEVDQSILSAGGLQYRQALDGIARCVSAAKWPSYYGNRPQRMTATDWFMKDVVQKTEREGV